MKKQDILLFFEQMNFEQMIPTLLSVHMFRDFSKMEIFRKSNLMSKRKHSKNLRIDEKTIFRLLSETSKIEIEKQFHFRTSFSFIISS